MDFIAIAQWAFCGLLGLTVITIIKSIDELRKSTQKLAETVAVAIEKIANVMHILDRHEENLKKFDQRVHDLEISHYSCGCGDRK